MLGQCHMARVVSSDFCCGIKAFAVVLWIVLAREAGICFAGRRGGDRVLA